MNAVSEPRYRYRSIWISDVHLGTRGCNSELLLDFLRSTESDYLYLVGDIVDIWRMRRAWYWRQDHNDVVQKLLRKARKGTRVIYIPGNHDESFRDFAGHRFGRVAVLPEATHLSADGRRFLVLHGDQFDGVVKYAKWLAFVGDRAYNFALSGQSVVQRRPPEARFPILVALGVSEAQSQERRRVYQQLREGGGRGSSSARCRRGDLRPHPLRRDPERRRHPLLQRR
jgi:UDP-2,3-diacylglucosamine pyrophosphatase LpxH